MFALDSTTGHELWRVFLGGGTLAPPISFTVDGRQVIVVSAGRAVFMFGLSGAVITLIEVRRLLLLCSRKPRRSDLRLAWACFNESWCGASVSTSKTNLSCLLKVHRRNVLDSRKFWRGPNFIHTRADPFLHVHQDELFIFYEAMKSNQPGWIEGYRTTNLVEFCVVGGDPS